MLTVPRLNVPLQRCPLLQDRQVALGKLILSYLINSLSLIMCQLLSVCVKSIALFEFCNHSYEKSTFIICIYYRLGRLGSEDDK